MEFNGERAIIESSEMPSFVREDHIGRYEFACGFVKGKRVLDVAAGSGYGSRMLLEAGALSVKGVDVSQEAVEYAKRFETNNLNFEVGDAHNLTIPPKSFDLIVSFETIEHMAEPRKFLSSLSKLLVQGGVLIISTPNRRFTSPLYWINLRPRNPHHLFEMNKKGFLNLLSNYFIIDQMYGQRLLPNILGWWPVLCSLKAISLSFSNDDRFYYSHVLTYRNAEVHPMTAWRTGRYMIAFCRNR